MANGQTEIDINWTFNSGTNTFDYIGNGESLRLTFTLEADDGNGVVDTQTVVITVRGTNDDPEITTVTQTAYEDIRVATDPEGDVITDATDKDANDMPSVTTVTSAVDNGDASTTGTATVNENYGELVINEDGTFIYNVDRTPNGPVSALSAGQSLTDTFTYTVDDGNGGVVQETMTFTIQGATGQFINGVFVTGGSNVLEGFRFAQSTGFSDDDNGPGNSTGEPILTLIPTYTGTAAPGSTVRISVLGANGELLSGGQMTVTADWAGNWIANFQTLVLGDSNYFVVVETTPMNWSPGAPGTFQLFYVPAINPFYNESQNLSVDSILGVRLPSVGMQQLNEANRNPGFNLGDLPFDPQNLPLDIRNQIPPGKDENGDSGQGGDGTEENPEENSQGNPNGNGEDGQPGEPGGNQ